MASDASGSRALSVALAEVAEKATPEVLQRVLDLFHGCGRVIGETRCGRREKAHPQKDCERWMPMYGVQQGLELLSVLAKFSRHEEKVDDELGLGKVKVQVEAGSGLMGAIVAAGITLEEFKRLTVEERSRVVLDVTSVKPLIAGPVPVDG
jgi:hypothetical protein